VGKKWGWGWSEGGMTYKSTRRFWDKKPPGVGMGILKIIEERN
jgi:hypothetical protein